MTEHQPEQTHPAKRHNTLTLLLATSAVVLLAIACTLGGYLWGHKDVSKTQRDLDKAHTDLTSIRHGLAPAQANLDNTKTTLDATSRRLQGCDANQLLVIQVSRRVAVIPRL